MTNEHIRAERDDLLLRGSATEAVGAAATGRLNAPDQNKKGSSEEALSILARMLENRARRELHAKQQMTDRPP